MLVAPVYNFGIPAAMKAWIDQVVRAGRTFRFTEHGPVGLVDAHQRAWIVTASAGTAMGSECDFNTTYLRTILGFIGVPEVRVIAAEMLQQLDGEAAVARAFEAIDAAVATDRVPSLSRRARCSSDAEQVGPGLARWRSLNAARISRSVSRWWFYDLVDEWQAGRSVRRTMTLRRSTGPGPLHEATLARGGRCGS